MATAGEIPNDCMHLNTNIKAYELETANPIEDPMNISKQTIKTGLLPYLSANGANTVGDIP